MKKYYVFMLLLIFSFFTASTIYAQDEKGNVTFETEVSGVGANAAAFLEIGIGARAIAMGGAYTAVANDPSSLYWNPAGSAWAKNYQIELMHTEWLAATKYDFVGIVIPIPSIYSTIGFNIVSLDYGSAPVRTVDRPEGTGEMYDARDYAVSISYAVALTQQFSFGMTGKYISQRIWSESGSAMAIDVGVFYYTGVKGFKLGASISNFGSNIQLHGRQLTTIVDPDPKVSNFDRVPVDYKVGSYPLPLLFRFGLSYDRSFGKFGDILVALDINHPSNATESINLGMEYGFGKMFYLRGGYQNLFEKDSINGLTLGGGIDYFFKGSMGIRIDYAWSEWGILDSSQRFSLGLVF